MNSSDTTAYERILDALREHGRRVIDKGTKADAQCPAHDDSNPSLSVTRSDGRALVWCHGPCDTRDVVAALGLSMADLYDERRATYRYTDGRIVSRYYGSDGKKAFSQTGAGAGATSTLYHPDRLQAAGDGEVFLVEGEADVHAIEGERGVATTAPQGADSFHKVDVSPLAGRYVTVVVDRDAGGDKWAAQVARKLAGVAARYRFVHAEVGCKDASDHIAAGHGLTGWVRYQPPEEPPDDSGPLTPDPGESGAQPARKVRLLAASTIKPKRVRWMWDGRVPLGEITLVAGREGSGKSTFLAWLVRAITRGELPGEFYGQPRAVLYAAAEDSWAYTVVPRLIAAGADLDLVYRVEVDDQEHGQTRMSLPKDTADVLAAGAEIGAAVLMLDPGLSFLDDRIDTYRTPEVRPALEALRSHAERYGLSVVMLCHFNKGQGTDVLTKIAGARAFAEVARAALAVAVDEPEQDEGDGEQDQTVERTAILSQAKNNLGRMDQPNLTYTIRDAIIDTEDGDAHVGRLHWTGESRRTAEQALNGAGYGKRKPLGDTGQAITNYLRSEGHPVALAEVIQALPDVAVGTLKKELRRMVERGQAMQPARGVYALPGGAFRPATFATSATFPAHTHSLIDDDEWGDATSATSESGEVAKVAKVAGGQGRYQADATSHGNAA